MVASVVRGQTTDNGEQKSEDRDIRFRIWECEFRMGLGLIA